MQTSQGSMLASLRAVNAFLDENAAALGGVINTGARLKLTDAITDLSTRATVQTGNRLVAQGETQFQATLRLVLMRDHMAPIARIARAELPTTPQIEPLRMPRGKPTIEKLAAAAKGMANAAAPHAPVFIAAGLSDDFVTQLDDAADALLKSATDRTQNRSKRTTATSALKSKLSAGRRIVHILDAFVKTALKDDQDLLAGWNKAKRVQLNGTRRTTPAAPAASGTPVAVPAAPAAAESGSAIEPAVAPAPIETPAAA